MGFVEKNAYDLHFIFIITIILGSSIALIKAVFVGHQHKHQYKLLHQMVWRFLRPTRQYHQVKPD
ncbi:BnaAnng04550D [Brassica napus]|uniref:BnaAnng04550D protein n=1 Tax=Brassica napus TaxID=3708 RepID=A0A078CEG3_BRANA|nr:BnaAnng04550D [Brassica napus]